MSSYAPLPTGSDALWLHSFAGAGAIVHSEHCTCRCGVNNNNDNGRSSSSRVGLSSFSSSSSSRRASTIKRVFQTSLALLFLCTAFLIYLHSPAASSAEDDAAGRKSQLLVGSEEVRAGGSQRLVVDGDALQRQQPSRSRRMIRALRSSSAERSEIETNEIRVQPPQPKPQQQPQPQHRPSTSAHLDGGVAKDSSPSTKESVDSVGATSQHPENNNNDINNANHLDSSSSASSSSSSSQIPQTDLKDILFTVKTTAKFHKSRLPILLDTWVSFVRDNTYFFTDADDAELARRLPPNRLVNTNCSSSHNRKALCCKMAAEFDAFLKDLTKRWFCHVDDDTYVNVPEMLRLLRTFDHREDWYLGKPSLRHPIEIIDRDHMNHLSPAEEERVVQMRQASGNNNNNNINNNRATFWFATGGAGFCISRALATKMAPVAGEGRFKIVGDNIRMTDDITMGYVVEHVLRQKLTVVDRFHSHLESMRLIPPSQIESQVTLSYGSYGNEMNVLRLKGFSEREDPSRLRSLHCRLFPGSSSSSSSTATLTAAGSTSAANPLICPDRSALLRRR